MNFVCLIHHTQEAFAQMSEAEHTAMQTDSLAYDRELMEQGKLFLAQALRLPDEAKTVRSRGPKPVITDGPFAETKEQIIGLIVIEAQDMEEAVEIAGLMPLARTGHVEVREAYSIHD
jgi:hypothetical protein